MAGRHATETYVDEAVSNATSRLWVAAVDFTGTGSSASQGRAGNRYPAWLMDSGSAETVQTGVFIPDGWATAHVDVYWTNAGTGSGGVAWRVGNASAGEGESLATDHSAGTEVAETAPGQDVLAITRVRTDMEVFPSEVQHFRIDRRPSNSSDTLSNDAAFLGFLLTKAS